MNSNRLVFPICIAAAVLGPILGCKSPRPLTNTSVANAWRQHRDSGPEPAVVYQKARQPSDAAQPSTDQSPIATVNGRTISRERFVSLLLRTQGPRLMEQVVGLAAAEHRAAALGLVVTEEDIRREYRHSLLQLIDPLSSITQGHFDEAEAEKLLEAVLVERNFSREELMIVVRRTAYLRKIIESQQVFNEEQLREEFDRLFGPKVSIRHIQLATLGEVARVRERISAGEDFGQLATRYSANVASAENNGLLDLFSANDDQIPAAIRLQAFAMTPGQISAAVRVGHWYHLIQLEAMIPGKHVGMDRVRPELEQSLRNRLSEQTMFEAYEKLYRTASIAIHDPVLKEAYDKRRSGQKK